MERGLRVATWTTLAAQLAVMLGFAVLFGQALSEVLANPQLSLIDGYWIGRLPWTAVGMNLVVIGATVAAVLGTVTAWLTGGAVKRVLSALLLAVAAFWWFTALLPQPGGAPCDSCPQAGPDPITVAYSSPQVALPFLVLPASIIGSIALSARRSRAGVADERRSG